MSKLDALTVPGNSSLAIDRYVQYLRYIHWTSKCNTITASGPVRAVPRVQPDQCNTYNAAESICGTPLAQQYQYLQ
jgi:hypothetical protein